jgi:hypothetical protein
MSGNADKRRIIAEEMFAWAEMIFVLLDRIILALREQYADNECRQELLLRARKIESLFTRIEELIEIQDEADLLLEEVTGLIDRLRELITSTHAMIDLLP